MYATKGSRDDEFVTEWMQPAEEEHAFFSFTRSDVLLLHGYREKYSQGDPHQRVYQDVETAKNSRQVDLQNYSKVFILYHPWTTLTLSQQDFKSLNPCAVKEYSSTTDGLIGAIESLRLPEEVATEIKFFFPRQRIARLSRLKHRIAHLFLPIDIDLQGLIETGFRQDYWNEVVESYRDGRAVGNLAQARQLLYGTQGEEDTVEKVKEDARKNAPTDQNKTIDDAWKGVGKLLPNSNNREEVDSDFEVATSILEGLQSRDKRDSVKALCRDRSNPFHQWFTKLDEALDKLREALPKKGSAGT
jgi:hypothetical protein